MGIRKETHSNQRALVLTLFISAISTIFCAFQLLRIPADVKNVFLFGLSKERLLMLSGFVILFLLIVFSLFFQNKIAQFLQQKKYLKNVFLWSAVISLFLLLLPDYRFGGFAAIYIRISPYLLCIFLISSAFSLYYGYLDKHFLPIRETLKNLTSQKKFIFSALFILIIGIVFVELTGLGKTVEKSLWNKNGIPLQSIQLYISFAIFCLLWKIGLFKKIGNNKKALNFFLIWAVSALVWSSAPFMHHFFAPGPYEPNHTYYPYSDASSYDMQSQTALNGWGFNYGNSLLKPTVVFMSFISHLIAGNDTTKSMLVQSAIYAILPAVIYLFGTSIGGNGCGYLAAVFSILKEWNALRTRSVSTVHSRLVMSEFLTQIFLALLCYAVFRWLQKNGKESLYAILAGGALTLGIFTRYNFFAFLPAVLLIIVIGYWKNFRRLVKPLSLFFLSILLTTAPFFFREKNISWNIFSELTYTVKYVLIRQRIMGEPPLTPDQVKELMNAEIKKYSETTKSSADEIIAETDETSEEGSNPILSHVQIEPTEENRTFTELSESEKLPVHEQSQQSDIEKKKPVDNSSYKESEILENNNVEFNTNQIREEFTNEISDIKLSTLESMLNHTFHNLISSFLTLPMEWTFQDLHHLYSQDGDALWRDNWKGDYSFRQWISIVVWVLFGAATIGILIKNHKIAGFSILYFTIVYACSIGISRSSGGRYIVPINWVPMLLLAFCCTWICSKGKIEYAETSSQKLSVLKPICLFVVFVFFFSALFIFEKIIPSKTTAAPKGDMAVLRERLSEQSNIDWNKVGKQFEEGSLHITHGISIYPRFYYSPGGEHISTGALMKKDYSRMTFIGLNEDNQTYQEYLLPQIELINNFPQNSVYRAISCPSDFGYEDVLAVTIDTPQGESYTYMRDPLPEFACPVPEPICTSRDTCY